ncbi:T9SS type A sorting domain-containing protein [Candidatus Caldipriscus sp.]|nr:T9SS type A sorting domain-containing protein [Candidatus Caldipriscus sp.]
MKGHLLRTSALWVRGLLALLSVPLVALFTEYAHAQVRFVRAYGRPGYNEARSVQRTSDGGYIVAGRASYIGGGYDILLIKIDTNGDAQWAKTYGGTSMYETYSVQQTSDGGYILAGTTIIGGSGNEALLIKTDAFGNIQWAKTYRGINADFAYSVQQTFDGGYIVAGETYSFGTGGDILLIKTDANGDIEWAKTYGGTGYEAAFSVQQTSDSGYILAGATNSFGAGSNDFFLIKTNAFGNVQWAKTYGEAGDEVAYSVQQTSGGGYIVAGATNSFGAGFSDILLIKTNASGNLQWSKTYGGTSSDLAYSVQQTSDGGYIVAGYTGSFGAGSYDAFLVKTDTFGNLQWVKTYGGTGNDRAYSVQQTSDGGYIVAGETYPRVFLIKTDANGDIGSCSIVSSAIPTLGIISPRVDVASPSVSSPSLSVNSVSPTDTSPALMILIPCPSTISESCQIASGIITPYKGGIKVSGSGEFEVKVYNVSGVMVKSAKGKNEVKLDLSRGVYFVEVISGGKVIREKVVIR